MAEIPIHMDGDRGPLDWFAVRVRSNCEWVVDAQLQARGIESFLPAVKTLRRWSDRVKELEAPLFPGYLFCRIDVRRRLPVLSTGGVVGLVGFGPVPEVVPASEIEAVKSLLASRLSLAAHPFLRSGQQVRIKRGPLRDVEGLLVRFKGTHRLVVSVTLLERSVAVEVDADLAEPVNRHARPAASGLQGQAVCA